MRIWARKCLGCAVAGLLPLVSFSCGDDEDATSKTDSGASEATGEGATTSNEGSTTGTESSDSEESESESGFDPMDMGGEECLPEDEACTDAGEVCCEDLICGQASISSVDTFCIACLPLGVECGPEKGPQYDQLCCSGVCSSEGQGGGVIQPVCM